MYALTVAVLISSSRPISRFVRPCPTRMATVRSPALSRSEQSPRPLPPRIRFRFSGERHHPADDVRGEHRLTRGYQPDRARDLRWRGVLEEESAGAGPHRPPDVLVGVEGGEQDDLRRVLSCSQSLSGGQSVELRHPDVHQYDIGPVLVDRGNDLGTVADSADDRQVVKLAEHHRQSSPHESVIVHDEHPDR